MVSSTLQSKCADQLIKSVDWVANTPVSIPRINKASREIHRGTPIFKRLYQDAISRREQSAREQVSIKKQLSDQSLKILIKALLKQFATETQHLEPQVNYTKYLNLFKKLRFLRINRKRSNEQIVLLLQLWQTLTLGQSKVPICKLKVAIMGIMGFFQHWMSIAENFNLTQIATLRFHQKFQIFYENRTRGLNKQEEIEEIIIRKPSLKNEQDDEELLEPQKIANARLIAPFNSFRFQGRIRVNNSHTFTSLQERNSMHYQSSPMDLSSYDDEFLMNKTIQRLSFDEMQEDMISSDYSNSLSIQSESSEQIEQVIFDVYIGEANAKMCLKGRKNIEKEVRKFSNIHGLSDKERSKLLQYAQNVINSVQTKICCRYQV